MSYVGQFVHAANVAGLSQEENARREIARRKVLNAPTPAMSLARAIEIARQVDSADVIQSWFEREWGVLRHAWSFAQRGEVDLALFEAGMI